MRRGILQVSYSYTEIELNSNLQSIYLVNEGQAGLGYICFVLQLIEAIKFVDDYRTRARGKGGQAWATAFRRTQFQALSSMSAQFSGMEAADKETLMKEPATKSKYEEWQRKNEMDVTAMNRIYDLYQMVKSFVTPNLNWRFN